MTYDKICRCVCVCAGKDILVVDIPLEANRQQHWRGRKPETRSRRQAKTAESQETRRTLAKLVGTHRRENSISESEARSASRFDAVKLTRQRQKRTFHIRVPLRRSHISISCVGKAKNICACLEGSSPGNAVILLCSEFR